jgi:hypothetical protein
MFDALWVLTLLFGLWTPIFLYIVYPDCLLAIDRIVPTEDGFELCPNTQPGSRQPSRSVNSSTSGQ